VVADIRRYPGSRKFPHFNREALSKLLSRENIEYLWLQALGGRRHSTKNSKSPNAGIKSTGFRNYADHMATDAFRQTVQKLMSVAAQRKTAIMCAEKLYWKCHRRFLSDYLVAQGAEVLHILESGNISVHKLTPEAVVTADATVTYPLSKPEVGQPYLAYFTEQP
jgi:uncharacterized protein (DUF488 family)